MSNEVILETLLEIKGQLGEMKNEQANMAKLLESHTSADNKVAARVTVLEDEYKKVKYLAVGDVSDFLCSEAGLNSVVQVDESIAVQDSELIHRHLPFSRRSYLAGRDIAKREPQ